MARRPSKVIQDPSFRVLPQNTDAEESLLSAILLDNDVLMDVVEIISPHDFYRTSHQHIFEAIIELSQKNNPIDAITLSDFLRKKGKIEIIGGAAYLASLLDVPMAINPVHYAKIIREKASLRRLIEKAGEITRKCFEDQGDVEDIIDFAESAIFKISEDKISPSFFHISKIIESNVDALEERQGSNALVTGVSTGFTDFDRMTAGLQNADLIILAARPSMGKCCEASTEIVLEDGSIATIEEIVQGRQANILTLNEKLKFHITEPSDRIDDGKKPVFRLITDSGRCIETTLTHPFLTPKGWKPLEKLRVGDKIAVARRIEIFGKEALRECEVKLLAYLVGDGNLTNITPGFTNSNSLISDDFAKAIEEFGGTEADALTLWLKNIGAYRKESHNKFISPPIFRLPRDLLALFLNRVFAAGGWTSVLRGGQIQLSYASVSEKLTRQIQHLLLRFGIIATLRKHRVQYAEAIRLGWQLDIDDDLSVKTFIQEIGIFATQETPPADALKHKKSLKPAQNDIYWDKIASIEFAGEKQVYDLTIPDTHNFVGNDICVHNTALALNIARNAAVDAEVPVAVFSLEMSKEQLSLRMLCAEARLDSSKLRGGFFSNDDWVRLTDAAGNLSEAPIFIDDTASISVVEIRAKARRLKMEKGLGLILIDYLQLMRGRADAERRDLEISEISRALKALAKELNVPVVALSQLNRKLEERSDKRPILSDLRESGCLSGDSKIVLSNGERITIREIADQRHNVEVFALNEKNLKTARVKITNAFSTGVRSVYRLETASGRQLKATANHKFRTLMGWNCLDQLKIGEHIAVPRKIESFTDIAMKNCELALLGHLIGDGCTLPRHTIQYTTNEKELADMVAGFASELFPNDITPRIKKERTWYQVYLASSYHLTHNVRNAAAKWLSELNVFGLRSYQKRVPEKIFMQPEKSVSCFLRHLWATDGSVTLGKDQRGKFSHHIYYASSSPELANDVSSLLLRLGINAVVKRYSQNDKGRDQYHVMITGKSNVENFINNIGAVGRKKDNLEKIKENLETIKENTNRDVIPKEAWRAYAVLSMAKHGITTREMQAAVGNMYCGTSLYKTNMSRERAKRVALAVKSPILELLSDSDIYWDRIQKIEYAGEEETFDLTVPIHHNFIANDIFAHNSLEQDADVVAFIYRDEVYNREENNPNAGKAELIIAKQRNGPVGTVPLTFLNVYTRFENAAGDYNMGD